MPTKIAKVVSVGTLKGFGRKAPMLFLELRFDGSRLSITGVEGPKRNGNAEGGCGQVCDSLDQILTFEPGFNAEIVSRLKSVWERWHLNDMRAGCEHQRAWPIAQEVEIVTYKLNSEGIKLSTEAKRTISTVARELAHSITDATHRGSTLLSAGIADLAYQIMSAEGLTDLPYWINSAPDSDSIGSGLYDVDKRETKRLGWLSVDEHPQGLMSKPCEVCGYKYGTEWRTETVPLDVIAFLESLPATSLGYPWHFDRGES